MTKVGSMGTGRVLEYGKGTDVELRNSISSSWREEFLASGRTAESVGDDSNELREEDIWEGDISCGEDSDDVVLKSCQETHVTPTPKTKGARVTRKLRSLLSAEMEAAANLCPSRLSTFSQTLEDDLTHAEWGAEGGACKRSVYVPLVGGDMDEGRQFRGASGGSLSVPLGTGYWPGKINETAVKVVEEEEEDGCVLEEDGGARIIPPHELVAREYAKSRAMAFSLFEGAGRTLKGMDLHRLRSAVWRQTGFMG